MRRGKYVKSAQFIEPFPGLALNPKLSERELTRALRQALAAEEEAVHLYESIADSTENEQVKTVVQDIANEEKVHVGEFQKLLNILSPDEEKFIEDGMKEVEDSDGKKTSSCRRGTRHLVAGTPEYEFDLVAPVTIYHFADMSYKRQALAAFTKAKKTTSIFDGVEDMEDAAADAQSAYNDLFKMVVLHKKPRWTTFIDRWGAKAFRTEDGKVIFAGDDSGFFGFYYDSREILKRIRQYDMTGE